MKTIRIPISLYIHIPWCIKKCPYCDFNSHTLQNAIPENKYIEQLIIDLKTQLYFIQDRKVHSIFIGGGTPSLFSPLAYQKLFLELKKYLIITDDVEITLEANPGTIHDETLFAQYYEIGINRISIGVQSFQNNQLKLLGRIHESDQAKNAIRAAQKAGFKRINIDLMFGLPNQKKNDAVFDLQTAIDLSPTHISWYQLTIEPNTYFHRFPPILPSDDFRFKIQNAGQNLLSKNNYKQYEISAYSQNDPCQHNLNYWLFGDYLGIGAGAHAKFTHLQNKISIARRMSVKNPKQYLAATENNIGELKKVEEKELSLEFMMNALRLFQEIPIALFESRTGILFSTIEKQIEKAVAENLLTINQQSFFVTEKGHLFLNDLLEIF